MEGEKTIRRPEKGQGPVKKRAIIKEYERMYRVSLTEEELDSMMDGYLSNPDISDDTKRKVKDKLKDKKKGGKGRDKKAAVPKKKD
jgi:hypothetical protein